MDSTLLQSILLLTMQAIEGEYGLILSKPVVRPLAKAFDELSKLSKLEADRKKLAEKKGTLEWTGM